MLTLPHALVDRCGPWHTVGLETGRLLDLALDEALPGLTTDLEAIAAHGIRSAWTRRHLEAALDETLDRAVPLPHDGLSERSGARRPWSAAPLAPGTLLAFEMGLAMLPAGDTGNAPALVLCDYPPALAHPEDERLPVDVAEAAPALRELLRGAWAWYPRCQVVGQLQLAGHRSRLSLLRLRVELPPRLDGAAERKLGEEACLAAAEAALELSTHRRVTTLHAARFAELQSREPKGAPADLRREAAEALGLGSRIDREFIERFENELRDTALGFWIGLVALLQAAERGVSPPVRETVLQCFDDSFGLPWQEAASFLEALVPLRLHGERLDALRRQLVDALSGTVSGPHGETGDHVLPLPTEHKHKGFQP